MGTDRDMMYTFYTCSSFMCNYGCTVTCCEEGVSVSYTHLFSFRNIQIQVIFITPIHKVFSLWFNAFSSLLIFSTSSVSSANFTEGHESSVLLQEGVRNCRIDILRVVTIFFTYFVRFSILCLCMDLVCKADAGIVVYLRRALKRQ